MEHMDRKSILEMSRGAILERANYEMGKVIDNLLDPNTKPETKRKLTITLELATDADRRQIISKTTAQCKLAPTVPIMTSLYVTTDANGEMAVVEMVPQIPGQMDMGGDEQESPKLLNFTRKRA